MPDVLVSDILAPKPPGESSLARLGPNERTLIPDLEQLPDAEALGDQIAFLFDRQMEDGGYGRTNDVTVDGYGNVVDAPKPGQPHELIERKGLPYREPITGRILEAVPGMRQDRETEGLLTAMKERFGAEHAAEAILQEAVNRYGEDPLEATKYVALRRAKQELESRLRAQDVPEKRIKENPEIQDLRKQIEQANHEIAEHSSWRRSGHIDGLRHDLKIADSFRTKAKTTFAREENERRIRSLHRQILEAEEKVALHSAVKWGSVKNAVDFVAGPEYLENLALSAQERNEFMEHALGQLRTINTELTEWEIGDRSPDLEEMLGFQLDYLHFRYGKLSAIRGLRPHPEMPTVLASLTRERYRFFLRAKLAALGSDNSRDDIQMSLDGGIVLNHEPSLPDDPKTQDPKAWHGVWNKLEVLHLDGTIERPELRMVGEGANQHEEVFLVRRDAHGNEVVKPTLDLIIPAEETNPPSLNTLRDAYNAAWRHYEASGGEEGLETAWLAAVRFQAALGGELKRGDEQLLLRNRHLAHLQSARNRALQGHTKSMEAIDLLDDPRPDWSQLDRLANEIPWLSPYASSDALLNRVEDLNDLIQESLVADDNKSFQKYLRQLRDIAQGDNPLGQILKIDDPQALLKLRQGAPWLRGIIGIREPIRAILEASPTAMEAIDIDPKKERSGPIGPITQAEFPDTLFKKAEINLGLSRKATRTAALEEARTATIASSHLINDLTSQINPLADARERLEDKQRKRGDWFNRLIYTRAYLEGPHRVSRQPGRTHHWAARLAMDSRPGYTGGNTGQPIPETRTSRTNPDGRQTVKNGVAWTPNGWLKGDLVVPPNAAIINLERHSTLQAPRLDSFGQVIAANKSNEVIQYYNADGKLLRVRVTPIPLEMPPADPTIQNDFDQNGNYIPPGQR